MTSPSRPANTQPPTPLEQALGYQFKNRALYQQALTHCSAGALHNERLEFLGDALLGMHMATYLYAHYPHKKEGELTRMRAALVNRQQLADLARRIGLNTHLIVGPGEQAAALIAKDAVLSDALEAILGGIYLDADLSTCQRCITDLFAPIVKQAETLLDQKDAKTQLQEWTQSHGYPLPSYTLTPFGPDHQKQFRAECRIEGLETLTEGIGASRKKAEQQAAIHYVESLNNDNN
jgi:ribonuclease-3